MKILILGKNGMLGHVVTNYFTELGHEVVGTVNTGEGIHYDAFTNQEGLVDIVKEHKPDIVINCIGILNKVCEDNKPLAVKVNSLLPHYIDSISEEHGFKFIHVSTDCVYEGTVGDYDETVLPDASSFYGRSKALGEVNNDRNLTLRTSIVGPDPNPKGIGLFQWFMNQQVETGGYTKVLWTGVTTIQLAKAMEKAIENNLTGLHHVVNNESIPKYDLLVLFRDIFKKDIIINENPNVVSEKTLIRTEKSFDLDTPSYEQMVEEMRDWVLAHQDLYPELLAECNLGGISK